MFKVENADFIADKLAAELLPNQEFREVYKNAQEAIERRLLSAESEPAGRIEYDVDWSLLTKLGEWLVACADNGDGMTRHELERYTTTLAVRGAGGNQGIRANQGMGLKIAGPTRHKRGVLIRSLKDNEAWMVQVGWNGAEYGLIPVGPNDELIARVTKEEFPASIRQTGSGTVVTFLGNADGDNTFSPADRPKGWLFKYLHQRFFRLSNGEITSVVRVPAGDLEEWPTTREQADLHQSGKRGHSFNLSRVHGTAAIWDDAADKLGSNHRGVVELQGDADADVPAANMHWWVLPSGAGTDVSTRTSSGGSLAVLFQNELHDWKTGSLANPFFARVGVLYGKTRISFILEPLGSTISSDFARAHVLVGGTPVFEGDAWGTWSDQFREQLPEPIKTAMAEEQARLQVEDPERARRIRDRLKDIMRQLRPRRFRLSQNGAEHAAGPSVVGPGSNAEAPMQAGSGSGRRRGTGSRGIGSVLSQFDDGAGQPANEVFSILKLDPKWVTESEGEEFPIVNGNGKGLADRAAALAGEDGATASILLLNREFRGYTAILAAVNEWANADGSEDKANRIRDVAEEWVEQKMIEAVSGLRQLENGSSWLASHFDEALSPVALTAAFMADRYHTFNQVKRDVTALRAPSKSIR